MSGHRTSRFNGRLPPAKPLAIVGDGSNWADFIMKDRDGNNPKKLDLNVIPYSMAFTLGRQFPPQSGFRRFLETPRQHISEGDLRADLTQSFDDSENGKAAFAAFERRMKILNKAMDGASIPVGNAPNRMPAGYTYLLQFIAHDMVASSISLAKDRSTQLEARDTRNVPLLLETLYGRGPSLTTTSYEIEPSPSLRCYLRLGMPSIDKSLFSRDAPRQCPHALDRYIKDKPETAKVLTETLLADPRNDDNGIVSQLTVAFILLHNAIVTEIRKVTENSADVIQFAQSKTEKSSNIFETARAIMQIIYRRVVRDDLMQRVLHPDVFQIYKKERNAIADKAASTSDTQTADLRPTIEFAYAAMRFGHAMLRSRYQFNAGSNHAISGILKQTSEDLNPTAIPTNEEWIIAWSHFFDLGAGFARPQLSEPIGPGTVVTEGALSHVGANDAYTDAKPKGLAYADLISSGLARTWTVTDLIEQLKKVDVLKAVIAQQHILESGEQRTRLIHEWLVTQLKQLVEAGSEEDLDRREIASNPPLSFFIRFEAFCNSESGGQNGERLGVLGSILIAESVFAALRGTELPQEDKADALEHAIETRLGSDVLAQLREPLIGKLRAVHTAADFLKAVSAIAKPEGPAFL